jgi:hypothetical protein
VVRVYVDGAKVQQVSAKGESAATFDVPDNLAPHNVMLEVCNEEACSQSAVQPVQTFGPLVAANIHGITPIIDVTRIAWTLEVDSNGDAATVTVTSDRGRDETFTVPVGVSSFTTQAIELDYEQTETVTVTLSDGSPARGPVVRTTSATTESPPAPSVVASRGAACNDDPAANLQPCDTGLIAGPPCTDASCAFVHIALSNWRSDVPGTAVYCEVNNADGRSYVPNSSVDTPNYYGVPGGILTVACKDAFGREASTQLVW